MREKKIQAVFKNNCSQEESWNFKEQNEFPRHYIQPHFLELWPCEIDFSVDWIHWQLPFLQSHTVPFPPFKEHKDPFRFISSRNVHPQHGNQSGRMFACWAEVGSWDLPTFCFDLHISDKRGSRCLKTMLPEFTLANSFSLLVWKHSQALCLLALPSNFWNCDLASKHFYWL